MTEAWLRWYCRVAPLWSLAWIGWAIWAEVDVGPHADAFTRVVPVLTAATMGATLIYAGGLWRRRRREARSGPLGPPLGRPVQVDPSWEIAGRLGPFWAPNQGGERR